MGRIDGAPILRFASANYLPPTTHYYPPLTSVQPAVMRRGGEEFGDPRPVGGECSLGGEGDVTPVVPISAQNFHHLLQVFHLDLQGKVRFCTAFFNWSLTLQLSPHTCGGLSDGELLCVVDLLQPTEDNEGLVGKDQLVPRSPADMGIEYPIEGIDSLTDGTFRYSEFLCYVV